MYKISNVFIMFGNEMVKNNVNQKRYYQKYEERRYP